MKKIKILQFTIASTKGGKTRYTLRNWKFIDKEKVQMDFITFSKKLDFEQSLIDEGCRVWHISCYPEENKEQFIKEFDNVLEQGYDIIHINTSYWKDTIVEERAKAKGIKKIIIHAHNTGCGTSLSKDEENAARKRHYEIRERLTEDIATDYWACSKKAAEWLYGNRIRESLIKIVKVAIDTSVFSYNVDIRNKVRKELEIEDKFVIGNVGRFAYQKNHLFLLTVFEQILKVIPETVLILVGKGELKKEIEEQIKIRSLQEKVKIFESVADISEILQAMDIFALPSLFEGFPAVLVEAQTTGLPCVISDKVTREAQITSLAHYKPLDIDEWISQLKDIYTERESRKSMHLQIEAAGYGIQGQIKELESWYQEGLK